MNKKILSGTLAVMMLVSPAYAIEAAGGTGDVPVHLTQDATQFSVTVPTVLPVDVSATGIVTVANENKIINNSFGPVEVKSVSVESLGDWTLVDFNTDFKSKKVGLHEYGFQMNQADVQPDGSCAAEFEVIPGNGQINFVYNSKVATQNTSLDKENIANVVFTIGWSDENATRPQLNATHKISKPKMDAVLKNLTGKITFATTAYQGEGGVDISETGDGSVMAVVSGQDAIVYSEGGVLGIDTNSEDWTNTAMFYQYKAKEMDLCGLDMSKMRNTHCMFYECISLTTLNLSGVNMGQVTNAKTMFANCTSLTTIDLSSVNMSNVKNTHCMFDDCTSLTTVDLSGVNMSNVTDTSYMFYGCNSLITFDLSGVDMSQVTDASCMFSSCKSLATLNLSGVNMNKTTSTYFMFSDCYSLTSIILSGANLNQVTDTRGMFSKCTSLTTIDLTEVDMSHVTDTELMFYECNALKTCYAKTQQDCNKLNNSGTSRYPKPSNVNFVIKPAV